MWTNLNYYERERFWETFVNDDQQVKIGKFTTAKHEDAEMDVPEGMEKFSAQEYKFNDYQKKTINFAFKHAPRALWALEMGLGKTMMGLALYHKCRETKECDSLLITAPKSAHGAWKEHFRDFSDAKALVVTGQTKKKRLEAYEKFKSGEAEALVITPETLVKRFKTIDPVKDIEKLKAAVENCEIVTPAGEYQLKDGEWYKGEKRVLLDDIIKSYNELLSKKKKFEWLPPDSDYVILKTITEERKEKILRIADEVHMFKNPEAARSQAFWDVMTRPEGRMVGMTGTPKPNGAADFYNVCDAIKPGSMGESLQEFAEDYAYQGSGYNNTVNILGLRPEKLGEMYKASADFMIAKAMADDDVDIVMPERKDLAPRIPTDDVQDELMQKMIYYMELKAKAREELRPTFHDPDPYSPAQAELEAAMDDDNPDPIARCAARIAPVNSNVALLRYVQLGIDPRILESRLEGYENTMMSDMPDYESPKMAACVDATIQHLTQNPDKGAVVFSEYTGAIDAAKKAFMKRGIKESEIAIWTGATSNKAREDAADGINSGKYKVLLGNSKALQTGANLQKRANFVVHLNTPWAPDVLSQSTARVNRRGQESNVIVFRPTGTHVEELVEASVSRKILQSSQLIGKKTDADDALAISMRKPGKADLTKEAIAELIGVDPSIFMAAGELPDDPEEIAEKKKTAIKSLVPPDRTEGHFRYTELIKVLAESGVTAWK